MSHLLRVTARDHSAVILMTELAGRFGDGAHASLQEIAADMHLSEGYLEEIAACLKRAGLIVGKQGPNGGYRLAASPKNIRLDDILTAIDGPMEIVDCQKKGVVCPVATKCQSKNIWKSVQENVQDVLKKTRLVDVMN